MGCMGCKGCMAQYYLKFWKSVVLLKKKKKKELLLIDELVVIDRSFNTEIQSLWLSVNLLMVVLIVQAASLKTRNLTLGERGDGTFFAMQSPPPFSTLTVIFTIKIPDKSFKIEHLLFSQPYLSPKRPVAIVTLTNTLFCLYFFLQN